MDKKLTTVLILVAIGFVVIRYSLFTVNEWERALKFQFGEFSGEEIQPGLHVKWPVANTIRKYDVRIQTMDKDPERFLTVNKEELLIDSFVKWRIKNLQEFFKSVSTKVRAENRLQQKVNNSIKEQIARRTISQVVADDRALIMESVQKAVDEEAEAIGIEVIDVRLKRVDLANEIRGNVYDRMQSERERIAKEKRATGSEVAEQIRARADRDSKIIVAEAIKQSETMRGEGDATATKIYADSFGRDESFYDFYRSLNAYRETFNNNSDLMVIDPNSEFFKYFKSDR